MFGSDSTIRRTLLHLTSTNGWCTIRETRSTKAKYGPAIAGVGWIVLVSVFLFSSVNIFIRQWLQTLYVTILFFISPSSAYTLLLSLSLSSTSFSFFPHLISAPVQELRLSLISSRCDDLVWTVVHGRMVVSTRSLPFALQIVVRYQLIIISFR